MHLNNKYPSFVAPQKYKELENALMNTKHTLLQGPSGCAKTHTLHFLFQKHTLPFEYIESPSTFSLLTSNSIVLTDIETKEQIYSFYSQLKAKKTKARKIVIETRCIFQKHEFDIKLGDLFDLVNFNKITDTKIKRVTSKLKEVNGNLHRIKILDYIGSADDTVSSFYHFIGKIFYGSSQKKSDVRANAFDRAKTLNYLRANCFYFLCGSELRYFIELVSECEDVEVLIYYILGCEKIKPESFYGFRPLEWNIKSDNRMLFFR